MHSNQKRTCKHGFDDLNLNTDEEKLLSAFRQFHSLKPPEMAFEGITRSDVRVLWQLYSYLQHHAEENGMPVSELSESSHMMKAAISRSLKQLEEAKLVVRLQSAEDRRFTKVSLTPAGNRKIKIVIAQTQRLFDLVSERLPVAEIDQITSGLTTLYEVISDSIDQLNAESSSKKN